MGVIQSSINSAIGTAGTIAGIAKAGTKIQENINKASEQANMRAERLMASQRSQYDALNKRISKIKESVESGQANPQLEYQTIPQGKVPNFIDVPKLDEDPKWGKTMFGKGKPVYQFGDEYIREDTVDWIGGDLAEKAKSGKMTPKEVVTLTRQAHKLNKEWEQSEKEYQEWVKENPEIVSEIMEKALEEDK